MGFLFDIEALRSIGLTQALMPALLALRHGHDTAAMRVVDLQRDRIGLHDGRERHTARLHPGQVRDWLHDDDMLAVGDWVLARCDASGSWSVAERVPAVNRIVRRDSHDGRRQPLVANVDTAFIVMGLDHDYNLRRLERYLALTRLSAVPAVVVLSKADGCADVTARSDEVRRNVPEAVTVLAVDGRSDEARAALAPWGGSGRTLVLLGSSGAGKSTLTNTLTGSPGATGVVGQTTGAVRAGDERGRHTTTSRSLHTCADGACIIDTPGLRSLRLEADQASLEAAFEDIARLALYCQFRDCHHRDEPGCEVRARLAPERLANYHKLLREAQRDQLQPHQRAERVAQWKARGQLARLHVRAKRG